MSQAIHPQQGNGRYFVAALVATGDALCKPLSDVAGEHCNAAASQFVFPIGRTPS